MITAGRKCVMTYMTLHLNLPPSIITIISDFILFFLLIYIVIKPCVHSVWFAAKAVGSQRGQGGVHSDGRDVHVSTRGVQRLFHQEPAWRAVRTHLQQCGWGCEVLEALSFLCLWLVICHSCWVLNTLLSCLLGMAYLTADKQLQYFMMFIASY